MCLYFGKDYYSFPASFFVYLHNLRQENLKKKKECYTNYMFKDQTRLKSVLKIKKTCHFTKKIKALCRPRCSNSSKFHVIVMV